MEKVKDDIMTKMTREGVDELEYVKMVYSETMRRDAPAGMSKFQSVTKDMRIGGIDLKKD